jgi:Kef-type K+ transport system membrane component KefB
MKRSLIFYLSLVLAFFCIAYVIIHKGETLRVLDPNELYAVASAKNTQAVKVDSTESITAQFVHNLHHPFSLLILQMVIILIVSRSFVTLFKHINQPLVVGEILAGIFLGPSFIGYFFPNTYFFIFPKNSLSNLQFISQVGLCFFMFVVGMELDMVKIKEKAKSAIVVSHAGIIFSYTLGMLLSFFIYKKYAPEEVSFTAFALFMGVALSITAFPVLARILQERKMTKTTIGVMAITCAASDDISAWFILAVVIAIAKSGSILSSVFTIGLSVAFVLFMIYVMKPAMRWISIKLYNSHLPNNTIIAICMIVMLFSACMTEIIGIHALFGAFLAGTIMPDHSKLKHDLEMKLEDVSLVVFLPIFFAFNGLRTQIGLLNSVNLWILCGVVILLAVVGKLGGAALSSRFMGQSWFDSITLGVLMNTRGLMELVVLNIGYDLGILSPEIFAIMVIMALVTTFMTGPLLDLTLRLKFKN